MDEWHYHCDQFDNARMGEHGWRKSHNRPNDNFLSRKSTHRTGVNCGKLCRDGLWPIPADLITANPPKGDGPFCYQQKEHAESWWVTENGRVFLLIRHNGRTRNLVIEMQWRLVNSYAHIPGMANAASEWKWAGIQSREGY